MAAHTGPSWKRSSARLGEGEEVRGERPPPGQVVTISALQRLREQLSIPGSVRVRGHPGRSAGRMKQASPVLCLMGFVPAADKGLDSQSYCI